MRFVYGSVLVAAPGRVLAVSGGADDRLARAVVRVLGARHAIQAVAGAVVRSPEFDRLGGLADALHSMTDVCCAALDRRQSRPAAADGVIAAAFAVVSLSAAPS